MNLDQSHYEAAFDDWRRLLPADRIMNSDNARRRYGVSTDNAQRRLAGALQPESTEEVSQIVQVAQRHGVPLYAVSTGRNWGYGTATPVVDNCVLLDLSRMHRVIAVDAVLGTVTLQPGVTQRMLRDYLDERNLDFLVPVHGGGPQCSIVGNALERGYGITPYADHFSAVMSLEAVLPNGKVFRSPLAELGAQDASRVYKWGIGPYLDGLFSQSNMGVVTEMTIALARRPERVEVFYFWIADDKDLEAGVDAVRHILQKLPSTVGAINLMDRRRTISMSAPYPFDQVPKGAVMPESLVEKIGKEKGLPAWMGMGTLYGDPRVVKAARRVIRNALNGKVQKLLFMSPDFTQRAEAFLKHVPFIRDLAGVKRLPLLKEAQKIVLGIPSEIALKLTKWKRPDSPSVHTDIDPARDGTGLLWYTPLIPMRADSIRTYVDLLRAVCVKHAIEPLITLTSASDRCFDSSVPLLFDKEDPAESERAEACYRELFETGRRQGLVPYRYSPHHMNLAGNPGTPFWEMAATIKHALDPLGILSPGRYAPVPGPVMKPKEAA